MLSDDEALPLSPVLLLLPLPLPLAVGVSAAGRLGFGAKKDLSL